VVARHRGEAGQFEEAAALWLEAAERAAGVGASAEALAHYARLIPARDASSPSAPASFAGGAVRDPLIGALVAASAYMVELRARLGRGGVLAGTEGFHSEAAEADFRRALELCQLGGDEPALMPALMGLWTTFLVRVELGTAGELLRQMESASRQAGEQQFGAEVASCAGYQSFYEGDFEGARGYLRQALSMFEQRDQERVERDPAADVWMLPQDVRVADLTLLAVAEFLLGDGPAAEVTGEAAIGQAVQVAEAAIPDAIRKHQYSAAYARLYDAWRFQLAEDSLRASVAAEESVAVAAEHGALEILLPATIHQAVAASYLDSPSRALPHAEAAIAAWRDSGGSLLLGYFVARLADIRYRSGDLPGGLEAIEEAERLSLTDGVYRSETLRIHARLLKASGAVEEARALLDEALVEADKSKSPYWRLLAATDLFSVADDPGEVLRTIEHALASLTGLDDLAAVREARALIEREARRGR